MKLTLLENGRKHINLHLPSGLVLNRLSAALLSVRIRHLSSKQLYALFRAIKEYKKAHPQWKLVEVRSHDGTTVEIVV